MVDARTERVPNPAVVSLFIAAREQMTPIDGDTTAIERGRPGRVPAERETHPR